MERWHSSTTSVSTPARAKISTTAPPTERAKAAACWVVARRAQELFHATLNLWIDRPFSLVLAQSESRQEALVVAISARREIDEP